MEWLYPPSSECREPLQQAAQMTSSLGGGGSSIACKSSCCAICSRVCSRIDTVHTKTSPIPLMRGQHCLVRTRQVSWRLAGLCSRLEMWIFSGERAYADPDKNLRSRDTAEPAENWKAPSGQRYRSRLDTAPASTSVLAACTCFITPYSFGNSLRTAHPMKPADRSANTMIPISSTAYK